MDSAHTAPDVDRAEPADLTAQLKRQAQSLGFALAGVCPAQAAPGFDRFERWLSAGYAGSMRYLADRREAYRDPGSVLEGTRSLLMLALPYRTGVPAPAEPGQGRVACYAQNEDYHDVVHVRLAQLAQFVHSRVPAARVRGVVDTAPLLEREFAQLAGLGWIGKHTLLLSRELGSWFFLAALLTDLVLEFDAPFVHDHCGTCTACLEACPTQAFPEPYVLDARRCLSYQTIEQREAVPTALRHALDDWVFGCDICQEVCPWNQRAPASAEPAFRPAPGRNPLELAELFWLDEAAFRDRFRQTPLWRPRRRGVLRNAALVLGRQRHGAALPALVQGLADEEPLVRGACAWALGQLAPEPGARQALLARAGTETEPQVHCEIETALAAWNETGSP